MGLFGFNSGKSEDKTDAANRRQFERARVRNLVAHKPKEATQPQISNLSDISAGGLKFYSNYPYEIGEVIDLEINFMQLEDPVKIKANVIFSKQMPKVKKYEIGCRFLTVPEDIRDFIDKNVDSILKGNEGEWV
ncbi:MAG: PilZ domain-containing protein [Candidatus Omnitrophica bacterium]|nr:PilZ domain-containing protein [Candidatus Omnitrophota bacterium]